MAEEGVPEKRYGVLEVRRFEFEPYSPGGPPRIKWGIIHLPSGNMIPKFTGDYPGAMGPEIYYPSLEHACSVAGPASRKRRLWRFTDFAELTDEQLADIRNTMIALERRVTEEAVMEGARIVKARREAKEARKRKYVEDVEEAVAEGRAVYLWSGDVRVPSVIVDWFDGLVLHRGLPQERMWSWWYVTHAASGLSLYRSKSRRRAEKAGRMLSEAADWSFTHYKRLSEKRKTRIWELAREVAAAVE